MIGGDYVITLMFTLIGLVLAGGGFAFLVGFILIVGIIKAIISKKPPGKIEQKSEIPVIEQHNYRYLILNMTNRQIVGAGDDYLEICRKKRDLGNGFIIKDTQYIKKKVIM